MFHVKYVENFPMLKLHFVVGIIIASIYKTIATPDFFSILPWPLLKFIQILNSPWKEEKWWDIAMA